MKYMYLNAWVNSFQDFTATLENIWLAPDCLYFSLKKAGMLVLVQSARDSFIYLRADYTLPEGCVQIWNHLSGCKLYDIQIMPSDRIISIKLSQRNIYNELKEYQLICELMPPKPNVIICKPTDSNLMVQDALIKYTLSENPMRMVLSNQPYYPPKTSFTPEVYESIPLPLVKDIVPKHINHYFLLLHQHSLVAEDGKHNLQQKIKTLQKEAKRVQKKIQSQEKDLAMAEQAEFFRACAEAIKPNMNQLIPGQESFTTTNYLDPELSEITVTLMPEKSPLQNLNIYLKKYHKAKNGLLIIQANLAKSQTELEMMNALISRMEQGEDIDIESSDNASGITHRLNQLEKILSLRIDEGWHIYVGRKAKENDFVTTKLGKPQDWWFHSRIYRGAHVLLRNYKKKQPSPELVRICCSLAAWYSQAKFSLNVPVDYTQIRYVRKPRGSAAGFVTYTNYKTFFATPQDMRAIRSELNL